MSSSFTSNSIYRWKSSAKGWHQVPSMIGSHLYFYSIGQSLSLQSTTAQSAKRYWCLLNETINLLKNVRAHPQTSLKEFGLNIKFLGDYKFVFTGRLSNSSYLSWPPVKACVWTLISCGTASAGCEVLPGCDPPVSIRVHPVARRPGLGMQVTEAALGNKGENAARGGSQKPDP